MTANGCLTWPQIIKIAALAGADPKTVKRVIEGRPTRPSVRARITEAMLKSGLLPPGREAGAAAEVALSRKQEAALRAQPPTPKRCLRCGNIQADHDYPKRGCVAFVMGPPECPHAWVEDRCRWCRAQRSRA
jgi:hypothetical protein